MLKWKCFSKEIKAILDESKSEGGLSKTGFEDKKEYFNETWENKAETWSDDVDTKI